MPFPDLSEVRFLEELCCFEVVDDVELDSEDPSSLSSLSSLLFFLLDVFLLLLLLLLGFGDSSSEEDS